MSNSLGEFAHRHVGSSYSAREGGGLVSTTNWEGIATGYGTVFGTLIFQLPEGGASGGSCKWVGQAFPEDGPWVNGSGEGTWQQVEGRNRWSISISVIEVSNGDRIRCEGEVDLATRTFTGQMFEAD